MHTASIRVALLASVAFIAFAPGALAQQDEAATGEIVVTGSRLQTDLAESPQPITVITAEALEVRGDTNVADALIRVPALQNSVNVDQSVDFGVAGRATLDLRNLGSNRTLVLVNGRRHVAGSPGSSAVDISSIPAGLIERVDVVTGGASAIYGSDAVTGVVNFVTRRNFEGTEFDAQFGLSTEGDAPNIYGSMLHGFNFGAQDQGNLTLSVQIESRGGVEYGDRDFTANGASAAAYTNPAFVFQEGDPLPPGVSRFTAVGRTILLDNGAPRFANTPQSLLDRARTARTQLIARNPTFAISSVTGLIGIDLFGSGFAGGFGDFGATNDLDSDGVDDCRESFVARRFFGCWVTDPATGRVRPFQDGAISTLTNQFGGDGAPLSFDGQSLSASTLGIVANVFADWEFSPAARVYTELKAVQNKATELNPYVSFDDSIPIAFDNPFIPAAIRAIIDREIQADPSLASTAQVTLARDHIDIFDPEIRNTRNTYRAVLGVDGSIWDGWTYDASLNYGRTEQRVRQAERLEDRFFAAVDATTDPVTGRPVCRSTLDPTALPRISFLTPGFIDFAGVTLTPGQAFQTFTPDQCRPLNLFGLGAPSQEARDFLRYIAETEAVIEQMVAGATLVGDSAAFFELPGGPIGIAVGAEYRQEKSSFTPDPFTVRGLGFQFVTDSAVVGEFDVTEAFIEVKLPILRDVPFFDELTVSAAARGGSYSTVGDVSSYKLDAIWAPVRDVRLRGGIASTVRAPNINELFQPRVSATFRPDDPCDVSFIATAPDPALRAANCLADGIPAGFRDPLTARFVGETSGNPALQEETSESWTAGLVLQPRWIDRLVVTADYWNIEIADAIAPLTAQEIVDSCYDAPNLNNAFCGLFTRNRTAASPTFLGFNFLRQTQLNFARLEAAGLDLAVRYDFDLDALGLTDWGNLAFDLSGTWTDKRNDFPFVTDPNRADVDLGELYNPEYAGNLAVTWSRSNYALSWFVNYQSSQLLGGVRVEEADDVIPFEGDDVWINDASFSWDVTDTTRLVGGVRNIFDVDPYLTETVYPASAVGRSVFVRISASF